MSTAEHRSRSSVHLGATLRSVMTAPTAGFQAAVKATARRERAGTTPAEGYAPYVLAAVGGAMLFLLWLKVSPLLGLRAESAQAYRWEFIAFAGLLGAIFSLLGQLAWSFAGEAAIRSLGGETERRDLRLVWGAALAPQMIALVFLLPFDLLIVGPELFTSARLEDTVASAWAALSVALGLSLAVWSLVILVRGAEVVSKLSLRRSAIAVFACVLCTVVVVLLFRMGALALAGGS